jgi:putative transport protein
LEVILEELLKNPIILILFCVMIGQSIGKIGFGHFKLGSSGILFTGLFMSFILGKNGISFAIPKELLQISLVGFIVAVGLKASKGIIDVIKNYGLKFMVLGIAITGTGALSTKLMMHLFSDMKFEVLGTYIGALTSSPGLATALELAGINQGSAIGIGYALAYIPGVIIVILFSQLSGKRFISNNTFVSELEVKKGENLSVLKLSIVLLFGSLIGSIKFMTISLGLTGGVLISSLIMGSSLKGFSFEEKSLNAIRDISLASFLAIVGLKYGYNAVNTIQIAGMQLLMIGIVTGLLSLSVGYVVGKFILKMDDDILAGAICGGMTSTPGLAAAVEAFKNDNVVVGYGATYPFALIGMIIFINVLI